MRGVLATEGEFWVTGVAEVVVVEGVGETGWGSGKVTLGAEGVTVSGNMTVGVEASCAITEVEPSASTAAIAAPAHRSRRWGFVIVPSQLATILPGFLNCAFLESLTY